MRLMGLVVLMVLSGILGGMIALLGSIYLPIKRVDAAAIVAPRAVAQLPAVTATEGPPKAPRQVLDTIQSFRDAGLAVGTLQRVTADSPCRYRKYAEDTGVQFGVGPAGEGFCLLGFDRESDRDNAWSALLRDSGGAARRITVREGLLLVYVGTSPEMAYRYETILANRR